MLRLTFITANALMLGGCLTTSQPVFDASNSKPVGEIPEFLAYADAWESYVIDDSSPRELIDDGGRAIMIGDMIVVQEKSDYYAFGLLGGRPISCVIYADENITQVAANQGVTVEVEIEDSASIDDRPVQVNADGSPEALLAFVRDQFANQRLACIANPRSSG